MRDELVQELLGATLEQQPGTGGAGLPGIAEHGGGDGAERQVEIGVGEDDDRRLAAQFGDGGHHVGGGGLGDLDAGGHRAGEGDLVDVRVAGQGRAGLAVTGHHVEDTRRKTALKGDPADLQRGERRLR